ncbi:MAG: hypothetical protein EOP48_17665 [Sphingobacteriales bacterium]|nr:MAG: hypothetical protein EOP48_17665 [Sphingobacteriales bacterium]
MDGFSINEALQSRLIEDVGTGSGEFIIQYGKGESFIEYAILDNYAFRLGSDLSKKMVGKGLDDFAELKIRKNLIQKEGDYLVRSYFESVC